MLTDKDYVITTKTLETLKMLLSSDEFQKFLEIITENEPKPELPPLTDMNKQIWEALIGKPKVSQSDVDNFVQTSSVTKLGVAQSALQKSETDNANLFASIAQAKVWGE